MKWLKEFFKALFGGVSGGGKQVEKPVESVPNEEHGQKLPVVDVSELEKKCLEFYAEATKEIGVNEYSSAGVARIKEYHNAASAKGSGASTAWCSSFVNFITAKCKVKGSGSAMARSWLKWGREIKTPVKGCIVVFWRGSKSASTGHVGLFAGETESDIILLSGNSGNSVCIKKYSKDQFLGYRVPNI